MTKRSRTRQEPAAGGPAKAAKARRRRTPAVAVPDPSPDVPYWIASKPAWQTLPEEVRQAAEEILAPAYRQFVVEAGGGLERSVGLTLVHLLWLEICGQLQMAQAVSDPTSLAAALSNPDRLIEQHLRLVKLKGQTTELMARLQLIAAGMPGPAKSKLALPAPTVRVISVQTAPPLPGE